MDDQRRKKLYKAVSQKDWEAVKKELCGNTDTNLLLPISLNGYSIIHFVVQSGSKEPLKAILDCYQLHNLTGSFNNARRNTVLHEAAICGNLEATKILVSRDRKLLEVKNDFWETPLFSAAAFGNTKIVKFLASQPGQMNKVTPYNGKFRLKRIHRQNRDGTSILHAAIQGNHFGTALELLTLDEKLAELLEEDGTNCLLLLAKLPSALTSGYQMGMWRKLLYFCLPVGRSYNDNIENIETEDGDRLSDLERGILVGCGYNDNIENIETGDGDRRSDLERGIPVGPGSNYKIENKETKHEDRWSGLKQVSYSIYLIFWRIIIGGCPVASKIWKVKRNHIFASELSRKLVKKDTSWRQEIEEQLFSYGPVPNEEGKEERNPLFAAITTGNAKLVKLILDEHPQAIEYVNYRKQNILHLAAMYRQKKIFDRVRKEEILMFGLARQIDDKGYTILHAVADTEHYRGGTRSGPAYQLQEELEWFSRVEKIMPSYYIMRPDDKRKTAKDVFKEKHKDQHKEAQNWIKETSQSCSAVSVLVATVVFAAAFTVPGGTNDNNGRPILLYSPIFFFFTISDIISLSCSLTSVVMFLSIISSPFELEDFQTALPRKLTIGFTLLFMSVVTTMLAFSSTIFLIIQLDERRHWTITLICSAAFFPVSVLALTHFPLFVSFIIAWKHLFMAIWKVLPYSLLINCVKLVRKKVLPYLHFEEKGK